MKSTTEIPEAPEGLDFFISTTEGENNCEQITNEYLKRAGIKAPLCLANLGTVLSLADRIGSCYWNCPGESADLHTIQYIAARASSHGRAIVRLAKFGFYDEALSLVRSLGEIANLLALFHGDPKEMAAWIKSTQDERFTNFRPAQIRTRIEKSGGTLMMTTKEYKNFCELFTHPVPKLRPQQFNSHGVVTVGGRFQDAGMLVVLNETAVLEAAIVTFAAHLCDVPREIRKSIIEKCVACADSAGQVFLTTLPTIWKNQPGGNSTNKK